MRYSCGMVYTFGLYVGGKGQVKRDRESLFPNKDVHLGGDEFAPSPASDSLRGFGKSYSWEEEESSQLVLSLFLNIKTSVSTRVTC